MRNLIITIICCLSSLLSFGQAFSQQKALQEISSAASSIKTMQCDFIQTKSLKMLGDKMVSKGVMYCQQPNKLRWEYTSPYSYIESTLKSRGLFKIGGVGLH